MKIVILDGYALNPGDLDWSPLNALGEVTIYERTAPDEVLVRCADADAVLTNKVPFDSGRLAALPRLRYIGVTATGYNIIDTAAAKAQGVAVTNIPAYSTESVAQMVFAHLLNLTNRVGLYADETCQGTWSACTDFCYWHTPLMELSGKRLGIVGLGNTGSATAQIAQAFGMHVYAYTSKPQEALGNIKKCELDELFASCDVVSLHCPLNAQTHHIVDAARLATMKPTAFVINTGRGPLVNEADMADALNRGVIAGFGADVSGNEPPAADNPLLTAKNAFITPHIAWATFEARTRLLHICIENLKAFAAGKPLNVVN